MSLPTYTPPMPTHQPQKPKAKRRWLVPVLWVAALLIGLAIGSAKPAPDPVTVEKIVTKEVPVEKLVEVPVTPQACLTALTHAGEIIDIGGDTIGILSDTLTAAGNMDVAAIEANTPKIKTQTAKLAGVSPDYVSAREECRASAK